MADACQTELVSKLLAYLKQPQTGFHTALTLRNMSTEVIKNRKSAPGKGYWLLVPLLSDNMEHQFTSSFRHSEARPF